MKEKRFRDRIEAGRLLATQLTTYANHPDVLVLALPRGGVAVAFEIARALHAPLDVLIVRKLGVPGQKELAMGAIATGGVYVLNNDVVQFLEIPDQAIDQVVVREQHELERREHLYRGDRPPYRLRGRIVILVDDGIATGASMRAAVAAVKQQQPARLIIAVPTAAPSTCEEFATEVDEIVTVIRPEPFYAVGAWYENFAQTSDQEVRDLIAYARREQQVTPQRQKLRKMPGAMGQEGRGNRAENMMLFVFPAYTSIGSALATSLRIDLGQFSIDRFSNGELHASAQTPVDNAECIIVGTLAPPDEQLLSILLLSHTLKKEGARKITALLPYLAYARDDKREEGRSMATAWAGALLQTSGIAEVITVDVHSTATQELFPIPVVSLSPAGLFAQEIAKLALLKAPIVAPDEGARQRCQAVARAAGMADEITIFKKKRTAAGIVHESIAGPLGPAAVIVDDILDTGGTLVSCCEQLKQLGVRDITIFVTHGLFTGALWQKLWTLGVQQFYCTDTLPQSRAHSCGKKEKLLSVLPLLYEYLKARLEGRSSVGK